MTVLLGLPAYLELMHASGLRESVERHMGLRECGQGWTDNQIVTSLMMLNPVSSTGQALAGGECGKGEEVHGVLKDDLAGGRLPSGLFGANAAWWAIAVLAFNPVWGYGAGSELCDEAAGVGRTVGQQSPEGGALRPDRPTGPCGAARQEVDHPSG